MSIEAAIAAAVAAQLQPVQAELARLAAAIADLRRVLPSQLVTVREAAEKCGVSESTMWRRVRAGEVPVRRLGRSVRVDLGALRPLNADEVAQSARAARERHPPQGVDPA